jgi:hypothetical protein
VSNPNLTIRNFCIAVGGRFSRRQLHVGGLAPRVLGARFSSDQATHVTPGSVVISASYQPQIGVCIAVMQMLMESSLGDAKSPLGDANTFYSDAKLRIENVRGFGF